MAESGSVMGIRPGIGSGRVDGDKSEAIQMDHLLGHRG